MNPEDKAREKIDQLLTEAGWIIQDREKLNFGAGLGIAIREYPLTTGATDYLLVIDRKAAGVLEAKPHGTTLSGVAEQTEKYLGGIPPDLPKICDPLPFVYESTGIETFFRDTRDPYPKSRRIFAYHRPETLLEWASEDKTLRRRLQEFPPLITGRLHDCQIEAITNLEKSFNNGRQRALIQMASGSGKTYTAISFIYRLIKFANARRILFLVDRSGLGRQTFREFQNYTTPDDGRKFTELYNVQHLTSNTFDPVSKVCISTIQRLYSMLKEEEKFDTDLEEYSLYQSTLPDEKPREVVYNARIPIETFDFIITDECHRSIYHLWRQVLEYFDSFIIGLTATPSKQTFGFFNKNLVMEYTHDRAVADGINVNYDVYRIKTEITEHGSRIEAYNYIDKRNKETREVKWEQLDEDLEYEANDLDRNIVSPDQIRTIIKVFKDKLFTEIFPGRTEVPKTLIFAKDDSHAEDIVHIIRDVFGRGNEFCKKITYRTTGEKPETLIRNFRNSYNPRIVVTVDMISTGTDIRPLECLIFMRNIKSRTYFEQMKGRGTRIIHPSDLRQVTPDTRHKTHFMIIDAVGVCESDKTDSRPLERKRQVPFNKLLLGVATGTRNEDTLTSLAGRLSRLDRTLTEKQRQDIQHTADNIPLKTIVNRLFDAVDPDKQLQTAKELFQTDMPTDKQLQQATEQLINTACQPFDKPEFRNLLIDIKSVNEQIIDTVSIDEVTYAGPDDQARERAQTTIEKFQQFIEDNKDELTALQILYNQPYNTRHLTFEAIKQLSEAIQRPPMHLHRNSSGGRMNNWRSRKYGKHIPNAF